MIKTKKVAVLLAATLLLPVSVQSMSVEATENPQADVQFNDTTDNRQLSLAKYSFMVNAKSNAEQEYAQVLETELADELEQLKEEDAQYIEATNSLLEHKISLTTTSEKRTEKETNDSLENLMTAVATLQATAADIQRNDVDVVGSSYSDGASEALVAGNRTDENYSGSVISITGDNRTLLEGLVMNEAGNQGFTGAALVAQTIHDTMIYENCYDVATIKSQYKYSGSMYGTPNDDVKRAVAFIFDKGGMAVQHRLTYYYNPAIVSSSFHEKQKFVVEYKDHRFFDRW